MSAVEKTVKLIKKGSADKFSELMQQSSFDINEIEPKSGKTLLQVAIQSESRQIVELLVKNKQTNLQIRSKSGYNALQSAILMNNIEYVQWILRAKVNQKSKNDMGYSAMGTAIKNKTNPEIVSKLLFHGFDVNENVPTFGCLVNLAINCNQFQNFDVMLKNPKVDIKIQDQNENTCLMLCVKEKKGEYVQAIFERLQKIEKNMSELERQFFLNTTDQNGDSILHIAAKKDYQTILDLLVKKGPPLGLQLDAKNKQGKTYLEIRSDVEQERQKQKHRQQFNQRRRIEQKKIKQKEKQEQRAKAAIEQEAHRLAEKRRKKEELQIQTQRKQLQHQMENKRKVWIFGISIIVLFGIVYLVFLSAMKKKSGQSEQF